MVFCKHAASSHTQHTYLESSSSSRSAVHVLCRHGSRSLSLSLFSLANRIDGRDDQKGFRFLPLLFFHRDVIIVVFTLATT